MTTELAVPDSGTAVSTELVLALMTVGRSLKARLAEGRDQTAAVMLLQHVAANPPLRVSDLAGFAGLDSSTVSRHVRTLEDAGLLARAGDPADRRASRLEITDAGRELLDT